MIFFINIFRPPQLMLLLYFITNKLFTKYLNVTKSFSCLPKHTDSPSLLNPNSRVLHAPTLSETIENSSTASATTSQFVSFDPLAFHVGFTSTKNYIYR